MVLILLRLGGCSFFCCWAEIEGKFEKIKLYDDLAGGNFSGLMEDMESRRK